MRPRVTNRLHRTLLWLVLCGSVLAGCNSADPKVSNPPDLGAARQFDRFRVYFAGRDVDGLPLTGASQAEHGRVGTEVTFGYGDCDPPDGLFAEGGCSLPLSVQNWSTCYRWASQLHKPPRLFNFRGAKATRGAGGSQLEIFTGRTTIVIWAHERNVARSAARQLRNVQTKRSAPTLPPPKPGSLQGRLPCQGKPG